VPPQTATVPTAVQCAIATRLLHGRQLANDEQGSPYAVDSTGTHLRTGVQKVAQTMRVYQNIGQYKAQFAGADLRRFALQRVLQRWSIALHHRGEQPAAYGRNARLGRLLRVQTGELSPTTSATSPRCASTVQMNWLAADARKPCGIPKTVSPCERATPDLTDIKSVEKTHAYGDENIFEKSWVQSCAESKSPGYIGRHGTKRVAKAADRRRAAADVERRHQPGRLAEGRFRRDPAGVLADRSKFSSRYVARRHVFDASAGVSRR